MKWRFVSFGGRLMCPQCWDETRRPRIFRGYEGLADHYELEHPAKVAAIEKLRARAARRRG